MLSSRYRIRTLLAVIALIAVGLAVYPRVRRHLQWRNARIAIEKWAGQLKRDPNGAVESYIHLNLSFDPANASPLSGTSYCVLTAEPDMEPMPDGTLAWNVHARTKPDPKRFFVIPPGKWVDDVDGVIETWDRFQKDGFKH